MKKAKSIGFGLLGLSVLGLWLEGGRLVNPETLWDGLQTSLSKSTGLEWHAGHVEMTLFPRPAIEIHNLEGGIPGAIPLVSAEKTYAKLSVMTLLGYGMNIPSLTLDRAIIAYDGHPLQIRMAMKGKPSFWQKSSQTTENVNAVTSQEVSPALINAPFLTHSKISIGKIALHDSLIKWKNTVVRPGDAPVAGTLPVKNLELNHIASAHPSFFIESPEIAGKRQAWAVEGHSGALSEIPDLLVAHTDPGKRPPWPFFLKFTFPHRQTAKLTAKEDFLSVDGTIPFLGDGGQSTLLVRADLQSLSDFKRIYPEVSVPALKDLSGQASFHLVRNDDKPIVMLSAIDMNIAHSKISLLSEMADRLSQDAGEAVRKAASSAILRNLQINNLQFHLDEGQPSLLIDSETQGKGGNWQIHLALPANLFSSLPIKNENIYELSVRPGSMKATAQQNAQNPDRDIPAGFHLSGTVSPTEISGSLSGVSPAMPVVALGGGWSLADDVGRELSILHGVSMSGDFHFTHSLGDKKWNAFIHNGSFSSDELSFQTELVAGPENGSAQWKLGGTLDIAQAHLISGNLKAIGKKLDSQKRASVATPKASDMQSDDETIKVMEAARESAISNASATSADLTLTAKDFSVDDVSYHDLAAHLISHNGATHFEITKGIGDNQALSGRLDVTKQDKNYHFSMQASPMILPSQLLFETFGAPAILSGASELVGHLEGQGNDLNAILSTLTGKLGASTIDSSLKRQILVDLAGPLRAIFKLGSKDIPLRCAAAAASFNNGRGDISAFGFEANHLSLTGNGWISPLQQSLDLRLNPQMSYAGEVVNSPLEVSGEFGDLKTVVLRASGGPLGLQLGGGNNSDNCKSLLSAARMGIPGPEPKEAEGDNKGEKVASGLLRILGL
ncbi:AsmA family protein [Acetobacteraceae bacterium]|nr:AsmA family protein [Acetobacteraceae bacterium]